MFDLIRYHLYPHNYQHFEYHLNQFVVDYYLIHRLF